MYLLGEKKSALGVYVDNAYRVFEYDSECTSLQGMLTRFMCVCVCASLHNNHKKSYND